ncbi:MAG: hypothetical protein IJW92_02070 [Clostridia bacterium]|nr:hypothetical protein [Clostridia bacterium]
MKKTLLRTAALLLVLITLMCCVSCAGRGEALMTLEVDGTTYTFTVNHYELLLSAMKGTLVAYGATVNGYSPSSNAFWDCADEIDGTFQTMNDYYKNSILETCRNYLAALYLFDHYGLKLSEAELETIEEDMNELVLTDGDGSKTKLNSVLSTYGVNYDMLKDYYILKAKVTALQNYLYSTLGENIKERYLNENYVHFYQIFLAKYNYVYETDKNGDVIYYNQSDNTVFYLKTEFVKTDADGNYVKDSKGNVIYYTDSTFEHISYDTENGKPSYKISSDGSSYEVKDLTEEELKQVENRAEVLWETLQGSTAEAFEAKVETQSDDASAAAYTDGYYLQTNRDYSAQGESYLYLDEIVEKLGKAEAGDVLLIESTMGFHVIRKYENTEKAYEKEENEVWFENFEAGLSAEVFQSQCEPYLAQIVMDEKKWTETASMKEVPINYFYY